MFTLGPIAFLTPWLLAGLLALPVLWWLLRAMPPAPAHRAFPGVQLLLGLSDPERMPERTPWWLLLLRMLALAAAILAFAEPVLNPRGGARGTGPVLVLMDGGWASAADWTDRLARANEVLEEADRAARPAAVLSLADVLPAEGLPFRAARDWQARLQSMQPQAWVPDRVGYAAWYSGLQTAGFETVWISDGLAQQGDRAFLAALGDAGPVTVIRSDIVPMALRAPRFEDGVVRSEVIRPSPGDRPPLAVAAIGPDPRGIERKLGEAQAEFGPEDSISPVEFDLPVELRNRVTRLSLANIRSAGAVALADDGLSRRKVALIAGRQAREGQDLIAPLHYLRNALETSSDLIEAGLADTLNTAPDVIVLADVGTFSETERAALLAWVDAGGLLVRFAGPRLAQSGEGQLEEDPLLPVRLRAGGRNVGGALSWGAPKRLRPFPESSPFFGLDVPLDVDISSQVMAQPDPNLPERVLAALEDGTPLVTGRSQGDGRVVLFHVTANAEWSSLPLSGLFVQMLERLAVSSRVARPDAAALEGEVWVPVAVLNGFGDVVDPGLLAGVDGAQLIDGLPGREMPPGIYQAGLRRIAVNLFQHGDTLAPLGALPLGMIEETMGVVSETVLKPQMLLVAFGLLLLDILATLLVAGRLRGARVVRAAAVLLLVGGNLPGDGAVLAQSGAADPDALALYAVNETVLAYVRTGDARVDQVSEAGLSGLTLVLNLRTAIEPVAPVAVDLETDELSFFPFIYWPVSEAQVIPSDAAYGRLNDYLRNGGMILFDTRDANLSQIPGSGTPNGRMLQRLAEGLDIPPLEPVPADHVLTRTFYLLQDFPGRYATSQIWVEAAPQVEAVEGIPFRNLNDGVTPVVIGGNDWASAWAIDQSGNPLLPVGRGTAGELQREIAYRFGVNLIMHVMTGNYKSDQVHVPALLERLGQ